MSGGPHDENGSNYWFYGDLDESVIKNITLSYKESFKDASEDIDKEYDKITSGIRTAMQSAIKSLQGLQNSKMGDKMSTEGTNGGGGSTQAVALELLAAISAFTGSGTAADYAKLEELLSVSSAYRIPTRNGLPNISVPLSKGIKVNFAWGKAGLYDAEKEVWIPITKIWSSLKPRVSKKGWLVNVYGAHVPMAVTTKYYAMRGFAKAAGGTMNNLVKAISKGSTPDATKLKNWTKTTVAKEKVEVKVNKLLDQANTAMAGESGDSKIDASFDFTYIEKNPPTYLANTVMFTVDGENGEQQKTSKPGKKYWSKLQKYKEDLLTAYNNEEKAYTALQDDLKKNAQGLNNVLSSIVSIKARMVGNTVQNMYSLASSSQQSLRFIYVPKEASSATNYFSVADLQKCVAAGKLQSAMQLTGIPTEVEVGFDFSQTDERGYPLKGFIEIKSLWCMDAAGQGFSFVGKFATGTDTTVEEVEVPEEVSLKDAEAVDEFKDSDSTTTA